MAPAPPRSGHALFPREVATRSRHRLSRHAALEGELLPAVWHDLEVPFEVRHVLAGHREVEHVLGLGRRHVEVHALAVPHHAHLHRPAGHCLTHEARQLRGAPHVLAVELHHHVAGFHAGLLGGRVFRHLFDGHALLGRQLELGEILLAQVANLDAESRPAAERRDHGLALDHVRDDLRVLPWLSLDRHHHRFTAGRLAHRDGLLLDLPSASHDLRLLRLLVLAGGLLARRRHLRGLPEHGQRPGHQHRQRHANRLSCAHDYLHNRDGANYTYSDEPAGTMAGSEAGIRDSGFGARGSGFGIRDRESGQIE